MQSSMFATATPIRNESHSAPIAIRYSVTPALVFTYLEFTEYLKNQIRLYFQKKDVTFDCKIQWCRDRFGEKKKTISKFLVQPANRNILLVPQAKGDHKDGASSQTSKVRLV